MPPSTQAPKTAAGQALMEKAEAIRDRTAQAQKQKRRLVAIYGQLHVVLKPTQEGRDAMGRSYTVERGVTLKFNDHVCTGTTDGRPLTDPEIQELVESHKCFTGGPAQPKFMAWEGDPLIPYHRQMPIQTIQGAIGAGPRPVAPPLPNWESLEPDEIRAALNGGEVPVQKAMVWEAEHRRRPAVLLDLAEALGRGQVGPPVDDPPEVVAIPALPEAFGPAMGGN
jgi:hypothetical protein